MTYKLWVTQGQGGSVEAEFVTLDEALAHVERLAGQASFAIEYPDGTYHDWVGPIKDF